MFVQVALRAFAFGDEMLLLPLIVWLADQASLFVAPAGSSVPSALSNLSVYLVF